MKKSGKKVLVIAILICIMVGIAYWLNQVEKEQILETEGRSFEKARVVQILEDNKQSSGMRVGSQKVEVEIKTGKHKGELLEADSSSSYLYGADCTPGLRVIVIISESENLTVASVYNYDRGPVLYGIILGFLIILGLLGGKKGWKSAVGLVFTFCCIIFFFLPLIYRGVSPILSAVLTVVIVTVVVMYLIDGFSTKSVCAMAGTIIGVAVSAGFAGVFGKLTHISGYNVDDVENLIYIGQMTNIRIGELLFAGILFAALGAVMDVAMSVASTMNEIHEKTPALSGQELFRSGINVGRDMMGTMSNTLILAFAGSSINTFVYIYSYNYNYYQVLNMYSIGIEIIQGISSTLGVILTVPVVSVITARMLKKKQSAEK